MTIGIPVYLVIASFVGIFDEPITTWLLVFSTVAAFVMSLPMIVIYLAVKDKTP